VPGNQSRSCASFSKGSLQTNNAHISSSDTAFIWLTSHGFLTNLDQSAGSSENEKRNLLRKPLEQLGSRLEAGEFARLQPWTLEQRLTMFAELQSMRNLDVVMAELNRWLAQIPGLPKKAGSSIPILQHSESGV